MSPLWTRSESSGSSAPAASSQNTQPTCSSACVMYSRRQGAHSGFVMTPFLPPLATRPRSVVDSPRGELRLQAGGCGDRVPAPRRARHSASSTDLVQNRHGCGLGRRLRRASPRRLVPGSQGKGEASRDRRASARLSRGAAALLLPLALAGCASSSSGGASGSAVVKRVGDGDTLDVRGGLRVRLVQIDAPELGEGECFARESKRELERLAPPGTPVELERDRSPRRRRSLRPAPPLRHARDAKRQRRARAPRCGDPVLLPRRCAAGMPTSCSPRSTRPGGRGAGCGERVA